METSSSRRTGKKLRDTNSWKGDDFGHSWHFRKGRLGGVGVRGKNHTDSMRRLHDKALVAAGLVEDNANFELDMAEAAKEEAFCEGCAHLRNAEDHRMLGLVDDFDDFFAPGDDDWADDAW